MKYTNSIISLIILSFPAVVQAQGEKIALCIELEHSNSKQLNEPKYTENDVTELSEILRDSRFEVVTMAGFTGKSNSKLMPTKLNIETQLRKLLENRKTNDTVLIVLTGHEFVLLNHSDVFLCPLDIDANENKSDLISLKQLYAKVASCNAGRKFIIANWSRAKQNTPKDINNNDKITLMPPEGVVALYACNDNEISYEYGNLHRGIFFHHLIEGIRGKAGKQNDDLRIDEIAAYVKKEVPLTVQRLGIKDGKQMPVIKSQVEEDTFSILVSSADRTILTHIYEYNGRKKSTGRAGYWIEHGSACMADWRKAAERGSACGMFMYARCLEDGLGVEKKPKMAVDWYQKAAGRGDKNAMVHLGDCYQMGIGAKEDPVKAVACFRNAAELMETGGMIGLSLCYMDGVGVMEDKHEAIKWATNAANLSDVDAMNLLGKFYKHVPDCFDLAKALFWFKKSAEMGNSEGIYNLGSCYSEGAGVVKNIEKSIELYQKAAALGNPKAMTDLGVCYLKAIAIEKDTVKAVDLFRKAAELGEPFGMYNLAACLKDGTGVAANAELAFEWFDKSSDLGVSLAITALGDCYFNRTGVKKDFEKAVSLFRKSADLGERGAINNLGVCYRDGFGVEVDSKKAFELFNRASGLGSSAGMAGLAGCYRDGIGTEMDSVKAFEWYSKAAKCGESVAMTNLGYFYYKGTGVETDPVKAFHWFGKGAEQGDVEAMRPLAWCYLKGIGVEQNEEKARKWLRKAVELGDEKASNLLNQLFPK